jgi:F0F1-type ATP synthase membrane subunit b/b'
MLFLWLVLLQLAIFAALVLFLRVVLTRNISNATNHLHSLNQDYTQKLEDAKKRQAEADAYYDQAILRAKVDAEKQKVQILKEAHDSQEFTINQTRQQSTAILEQANKARETIVGEMEQRIEAAAIERACELVTEVLPEEIDEAMHRRWVDELSKSGLDQLSRLNIPADVKEVEVVTAYPLTPDQGREVSRRLKELLKKEIKVIEKTDRSLIAGFKLTLGTVAIDGSLKIKITEAVRHAKHSA